MGDPAGGTQSLNADDDISGKSEAAVATFNGHTYPSSLRIHCGSADVMRNNSLPTWTVAGSKSLTTQAGMDPKMLAAAGSTAYVSFLDENGRNLRATAAVTLSKPAPLTVPLGRAQQLVVRCVSVDNDNPRNGPLFDIFLGDPLLHS